jgi:XTP/dITP diphosphohydrolase
VDAANNRELVRRLAGAPDRRRTARYRCLLAYLASPGAVPELFEGACSGRILAEPRGSGGFGYDPYFWSDDLAKTFGEATPAEKNAVSHRARALAALVGRLATP